MELTAFPGSSLEGDALGRVPVRVTAVVHGAGCAEGLSKDPALQSIYTKSIPNFEI